MISRLDPEDVQSLQSSSRSMQSRLDDKVIWIEVFRAICRACAIFPPSYPVDEMHTLRLRRAALAPARFGRLIESNSFHTNVVPPIELSPSLALILGIRLPVKSEKHFFVPGGRFLVAANPYAIYSWDLGVPDRPALAQPILVAHVDIEEDGESRETSAQLAVGMLTEETLRVVVTARLYHTTTGYVNSALAYDVKLKGSGAHFKPAGKLIFDRASFEWARDYVSLAISGNLVLIHLGNIIGCDETVVWDMVAGWYAFAPKADFYPSQQVIVNRNTVIQHDRHFSMAVWSCSPDHLETHPVDSATPIKRPFHPDIAHLVTKHMPQFRFPKDRVDASRLLPQVIFATSNWHCTDDNGGAIFDIILEDCSFGDREYQRSKTPIRGYRYKFVPSLQGGAYQVETPRFELQASFNLPPNTNVVLGLEIHLPRISRPSGGCGTRGNFDGSSLVVDNVRKNEYLSGLFCIRYRRGYGCRREWRSRGYRHASRACLESRNSTLVREARSIAYASDLLHAWDHHASLVCSEFQISNIVAAGRRSGSHTDQCIHTGCESQFTPTISCGSLIAWMAGPCSMPSFFPPLPHAQQLFLLIRRTILSPRSSFLGPDETMGYILGLPLELLLGICNLLAPEDILQLQSSCRALRTRFTSREVWTQTLRNVCKVHSIFFPSYPVLEMGVSRLQRASMAPARFARLLQSYSSFEYPPRTVDPTSVTTVDIGQPVIKERHFLVPGGRFLVVAYPCALLLFDLGAPDCAALANPVLILSEEMEKDAEDTLRVVVLLRLHQITVYAYDILFASGQASAKRVATLKIDKDAFDWADHGLLITSSRTVSIIQMSGGQWGTEITIVWNIHDNWYAFGPRKGTLASQHAIVNNSTVIQHDGEYTVAIWSCAAEHLQTYPADSRTPVTLPILQRERYLSSNAIPGHNLPKIQPYTPGLVHMPIFFWSTWCGDDGKYGLSFDLILADRDLEVSGPGRAFSASPIWGYRGKITPSLNGLSYQVAPLNCEVQATFELPPSLNGGWSGTPEAHLPFGAEMSVGGRSPPMTMGSGLVNHSEAIPDRRCGILLYSLPCDLEDAVEARQACLVCVLEKQGTYSRGVCMASGRIFFSEEKFFREPAWTLSRTVAHVYDLLRPWNDRDAPI
ncbi:hypothetical protein NMY22_g5859 [Coprinellus aureogranulatus]|nr:hypothetical protein NMY22_g5859 [Coprinellus aureogranulatus]